MWIKVQTYLSEQNCSSKPLIYKFTDITSLWIKPIATFLDLHLLISNEIVSTKTYGKRDDFDFEIINFPFLDDDVPCSTTSWPIEFIFLHSSVFA